MQSNYHDIELQNLGNKANSNGVPKMTFNDNEDGKKILNSASVIKDERKQLKKKAVLQLFGKKKKMVGESRSSMTVRRYTQFNIIFLKFLYENFEF